MECCCCQKTQIKENTDVPFSIYAFEIAMDIFLAVVLGLTVNKVTDWLGKKFKLSNNVMLLVQFSLIIVVLYMMKVNYKYLYKSWKGHTYHGVVFTAIFLAIQKNIRVFIEEAYDKI